MAKRASDSDEPASDSDEPASKFDWPASDSDEPASDSDSDELASDPKSWLRQDLGKEYDALLDVISKYDGWLLIVKGWSVTLSLAALGIGFQQRHYALFAIAAVTGAAFWYLDGLMKGFQYRYYVRMREIEYTSYLINHVALDFKYGKKVISKEISAPRIDMTWGFRGYLRVKDGKPLVDEHGTPWPHPPWRRTPRPPKEPEPDGEEPKPDAEELEQIADWRANEPWRRNPEEIYWDLRRRFWLVNVMLPHVVAVVLGSLLFFTFLALNLAGVDHVIGHP